MTMNIIIICFILWSLITHYKVRLEYRIKSYHYKEVKSLYLIWSKKEWNRIDGQYFDITYSQKLF